MPSVIDYARLSSRVYSDVRGRANQPFLPADWLDVSDLFGVGSGSSSTGFSAGVFLRGNDVVISYAGTSPGLFSNLNSAQDWITNFSTAFGFIAPQVLQAALLYEQVKQQYGDLGYNITFSGDSLGGGLASMMSVMFNRPATTFDLAPFALAINPVELILVSSFLATQGYVDSDLATLLASSVLPINPVKLLRERQIQSYAINGEALSVFRNSLDTLGPLPTAIDVGNTQLGSVDRHSISLVIAAGQVASFRQASVKLPSLLSLMFDQNLYGADLQDNTKLDFLERLIRFQFGGPGFQPDDMLNRFGLDMQRIAGGGLAGVDQVQKGLIIAGIEYYDFIDPVQLADFFNKVPGGVSFELGSINLDSAQQQGYAQLRDFVQQTHDLQSGDPVLTALDSAKRWFVQAGTSGSMQATGGNEADVMLGGISSDLLDGGGGDDVLFGGFGNDRLIAEAGNSYLSGGPGGDTYEISGTGTKHLVDSATDLANDEVFFIEPDGTRQNLAGLFIGTSAQNTWTSPDGSLTVTHSSPYTITDNQTGAQVIVDNFQDGDLGIHLEDAFVAPTTTRDIVGDFAPFDFDPNTPGIQSQTDDLGNLITDPNQPVPGRADTLNDSAGNDHILSGGGNDVISDFRGGNDQIETGAGQDIVSSGSGNDVIQGGADADILDGGTGNDEIYSGDKVDLAAAINQSGQPTVSGQGDFLTGGTGDDILVGGNASDALFGGSGSDILVGGTGDDYLDGDLDFLVTNPDWTRVRTFQGNLLVNSFSQNTGFERTDPNSGGDDVIYGGDGNDDIIGDTGNDYLSGDAGDDFIFGDDWVNGCAVQNARVYAKTPCLNRSIRWMA